jgi:hypothetical protein
MVRLIRWLIGQWYKWLWYDACQLREPFTCVLSRMIVANGVYFWVFYVGMQWLAYDALYEDTVTFKLLTLTVLFLNAWLVDHLMDYIREHPENKPNQNPWP